MGMGPFRLTCVWIVILLATVILIVHVSHSPARILRLRLGSRAIGDDNLQQPSTSNKTQPTVREIPQVFSNETFSRPCQGSPTSSQNISYFFRVDQSGGGDFVTVQAAVDAVPENSEQRTIIQIRAGIYEYAQILKTTRIIDAKRYM